MAIRRHTLLPLDDCLYALQPSIPHLTRSALHRCLQRHGISRLPDIEGDKPKRQRFKRYPIGFFHMDIAEVQTAEGKLYLFVGIDRYPSSSRSPNWSTRLAGAQSGSSSNTCWKPCRTASIPFELPPSEWSIDYESLDQGRDDECLPRSTSPRRSGHIDVSSPGRAQQKEMRPPP